MGLNLNWLDAAAIVLIGVFAIEGLWKGLIRSIVSMAGFILCFFAAKELSLPAAQYITGNTQIDESLNKYFTARISGQNKGVAAVSKIFGSGGSIENVLTSAVILMISFAVVFFVMRLLILIAASFLNLAAKLPVIRQFNRAGGLIFGIFKGVIILYIVFAVLIPVVPMLSNTNPINSALESSVFASNFYRYNIIVPWIKAKGFI